jgi:DNA end-binding protein Ku
VPKSNASEHESPGPRAIWSGQLSFALVSIPIELYAAARPPALRGHLYAGGARVSRHYYCPEEDRDLTPDELVRGFELPDGRYVVVEDEELAALAPKKSREIELREFTPQSALHPALFEHAYVLAPARNNTANKAYRLLAHVMHRKERAGIATFVLREHEYILAIVSDGRFLLGQTLRFADELRSPKEVALPEPRDVPKQVATQYARALAGLARTRFNPKSLIDPGTQQLTKLLEQKRKRGQVAPVHEREAAAESGEVMDLMRMLKESLRGQGDKPKARRPTPRSRSARG